MIVSEKKIQYSGSNTPGVLAVYIIDRSDVLSVLDPVRHRLPGATASTVPTGGIVLRRGTQLTRMKFPSLTCSFSQSAERSDAGNTYSMSVGFDMPGSCEDLFDFFHTNYQKQWVCIVEDANRRAYILGNEEQGLRMNMSQTVNPRNAFSVGFSAKLNVPGFLLQTSVYGFVLAEQFPDVEFGHDFSLDFNS